MAVKIFSEQCSICVQGIKLSVFGPNHNNIVSCHNCNLQFHYSHFKILTPGNKSCPNCGVEFLNDFLFLNTKGRLIPCQDGFHLSKINRNRINCIRCFEPIKNSYGIRSELKMDSNNTLQYSEVKLTVNKLPKVVDWTGIVSLFNFKNMLILSIIGVGLYYFALYVYLLSLEYSLTIIDVMNLISYFFQLVILFISTFLDRNYNEKKKLSGFEI